MPGPLADVRVVELAGVGPAPFCGMTLADLGAEVVRVDRADVVVGDHTTRTRYDLHNRGKRSIGVDLKKPVPVAILYWTADPVWEGGIRFYEDVYKRDARVLKGLDSSFRLADR